MKGLEKLETFIRQHNNKLALELTKNEIAQELYDTLQDHQTHYKSLLTKLIKL